MGERFVCLVTEVTAQVGHRSGKFSTENTANQSTRSRRVSLRFVAARPLKNRRELATGARIVVELPESW
jgi:hypothetical protein